MDWFKKIFFDCYCFFQVPDFVTMKKLITSTLIVCVITLGSLMAQTAPKETPKKDAPKETPKEAPKKEAAKDAHKDASKEAPKK